MTNHHDSVAAFTAQRNTGSSWRLRSDKGAEHWAVIASLVETCKLNAAEPTAYLTDVIGRIVNGHPQRRIDDLLPWAYPTTTAIRAVA